VEKLKYFQMALRSQNYIDEEMEGRLNSPIACFHLVQFFLPMCYIKTRVQMCNSVGVPVLLYGMWNLVFYIMRMLTMCVQGEGTEENNCIWGEVTGHSKLCIMSFMICTSHQKTIMMVTSWRIVGVGYVACMGVKRNAYRTLVAQLHGMTLFGRT